ncbi:MAG: hypothetical protein ACK5X3_06205 [Pseudomonadota bacterium]
MLDLFLVGGNQNGAIGCHDAIQELLNLVIHQLSIFHETCANLFIAAELNIFGTLHHILDQLHHDG